MSAHLLLDRIPFPAERLKSKEPARYSVIGEAVNDSGFLQALLSHGTFDGYYYVRKSDTPPDIAECYRDSDRLKPISLSSLHRLDECGPLVLFTSSILFQQYASFRLARKHPDWPICGITHTLSTIYPRVSFGSSRLFAFDALICTTPSARQTLEHLMCEHAKSTAVTQPTPPLPTIRYPVIPLGVDPAMVGDLGLKGVARRHLGIAEDDIVFLFLGRLSRTNKVDFHPLIRIFIETPGLPDGSRLIVAGDDTRHHLATELLDFASQFGSPRTVSVMPDITVEQKRMLLSASDVFIAVSDTIEETFGISVVEAMMSSLPVIASDWDGYRHLVRHAREGWLVPTYICGDGLELSAISSLFACEYHYTQRVCLDLDALSHAMWVLANKPDLRKQYGEAARRRALSEFAWPSVLRRYEELWHEQLREAAAAMQSADDLSYPAVYDYSAVFRHYATDAISVQDHVTVSRDYRRLMDLLRRNGLFLRPDPTFYPEVDEQIVEQCVQAGTLKVGEIVERLVRPDLPPLLLVSHVCRLIKNGLLVLCRASTPQGLSHEIHD